MALTQFATVRAGHARAVGAGRAARGLCRLATLLTAVLALSSCVSVGGTAPETDPGGVPPPPTLAAVTAPAPTRVLDEVRRLQGFGAHPGAQLRAAWLLQEQGSWDDAATELNSVLFGEKHHDGDVEALARYLRARGFTRRGDAERASLELDDALRIAVAPDLRERIRTAAAEGRPAEGSPFGGLATETPKILPRSAWNAASSRARDMKPMSGVHRITVHHSATLVRSTSMATAVGAIRGIQRYHQVHNGWGDIGYHFLIDPAGRIWVGRPLEWQGAHAGDSAKNDANVGICLLGNFVRDGQGAPPPAQLQALESLIATLCVRYRVDPRQVLTHQELKTTDCPGPYVQVAVERIRERLAGAFLAGAAASR